MIDYVRINLVLFCENRKKELILHIDKFNRNH